MEKYEALIRQAAREGAMEAIREMEQKRKAENEARKDFRFQNTKILLKNYQSMKYHAKDGIDSLAEINKEDKKFFEELMSNRGKELTAESITRTKARSAIFVAHVDAMTEVYRKICKKSKNPDDKRRYSVVERLCLKENVMSAMEIAEADDTYERAVYRDFDAACEKLSVLMFGLPWFGLE